jgi:hypothetical protein
MPLLRLRLICPAPVDSRAVIDDFLAALPGMKETLASLLTPKFYLFKTTPVAYG